MAETPNLKVTELTEGQSQKEVTINTGFETFDRAIAGRLVKNVAGGANVNLSASEWENTAFEFTGALTAGIAVVVPAGSRRFLVHNNTTGAFNLTVRGTTGLGVVVAQGYRIWLDYDGTEVYTISSAAELGGEFDRAPGTPGGVVYLANAEDSLAIGTSTVGAGGTRQIVLAPGAAPTTYPPNQLTIWNTDRVADHNGLALATEDGSKHLLSDRVGLFTLTPSTDIGIGGQTARSLALERQQTPDTAGNHLTVRGGGAATGASDKDGGDLLLMPGIPTGLGRSRLRLQTPVTRFVSGSADALIIDRLALGCFKALTNGANTTIVAFDLANNSAIAGMLRYAALAADATDQQVEVGTVSYMATNKAGTVSNNTVSAKTLMQQAATAGTLTVTFALSSADPALLQVTVTSSLTLAAGYPRLTFDVDNLTDQSFVLV